MESSLQGPEQTLLSRGFPVRALVWSIGLHALAIGLLVPQWDREAQGVAPVRQLQAQLRTVLAAAPASPAQPVAEPVPAKPRPNAVAITAAASTPAVLPAPTFVSQPATAASEAGGITALRDSTGPATVALAADAREGGPDAAGLRQYRLALAGEARRYKRYPEAARRSGLAGTAEVRVAVDTLSSERSAELARSSGHALLDAAALDMMRLAAERARLPESLHGQRFAVLLPVVFSVED